MSYPERCEGAMALPQSIADSNPSTRPFRQFQIGTLRSISTLHLFADLCAQHAAKRKQILVEAAPVLGNIGIKGHGPSAGSDLRNMVASSHDDPSVSENLAAHSRGSRATALDGRVRIPPSPLRSRLAGRAGESRRLAARSPAIAARKVRPDTSPTTILPGCGVALGKAIRKTNEQAPENEVVP